MSDEKKKAQDLAAILPKYPELIYVTAWLAGAGQLGLLQKAALQAQDLAGQAKADILFQRRLQKIVEGLGSRENWQDLDQLAQLLTQLPLTEAIAGKLVANTFNNGILPQITQDQVLALQARIKGAFQGLQVTPGGSSAIVH